MLSIFYRFIGTIQTHKNKGLNEFLGHKCPKFLYEDVYTTFF